MLFTSPAFAIFLPIVLVLYYLLSHRWQNRMLLVASYIFYGWWDWRFLSLMAISTIVDYWCGVLLGRYREKPIGRWIVFFSVATNLGLLGVFKYFNFFVDSFAEMSAAFGLPITVSTLNIVLPVGISFYTFQTLSYTIDVYRGDIRPAHNLLNFSLFVSFFPQLVAGPIERASHLLPEIEQPRTVRREMIHVGTWLVLWGLFKKVVVADNVSRLADAGFDNPDPDWISTLFACYAFAWQIYCDFSGYSDIARGCAYLMGFRLCLNFDLPYFSTSPSEFWRRWHISLSTWLRDYLYIPLGGNRRGPRRTTLNLLLTMLLGGLWHGANWTFVLWGLFHGTLLVLFRHRGSQFMVANRLLALLHFVQIILFFHITCLGWLIFRSQSVAELQLLLHSLATPASQLPAGYWRLAFIAPVVMMQACQYRTSDLLCIFRLAWPLRATVYLLIYWALISLGNWSHDEFIYFQF